MNAIRRWRKTKYRTQGEAADALKIPRPTYQTYESGRSEVPVELRPAFRELGFTEEFPELGDEGVTSEDLQALGRDLQKIANHHHDIQMREIRALGAAVEKILNHVLPESERAFRPPAAPPA